MTNTIHEINLCESLEQLFDLLKDKGGSIDDLSSLPTFEEYHAPTDTIGVWSYDDRRAIVGACVDEFEIVRYATGSHIWQSASDNEHTGEFNAEYVEAYAYNALGVYVTPKQAQAIVDAETEWRRLINNGEATQSDWDRLSKQLNFTVFN